MAKRVQGGKTGAAADERRSNLNDDTLLLHSRKIEQAKEALDSANGVYRAALKAADADGVNTKALLLALRAKKIDLAFADLTLRDQFRYRKLLGIPVSWAEDGQAGWDFQTDVSAEAQQEQDDFDAFADGEKAGLGGHSLTTCPHPAGSEEHQAWVLGWQQGQTTLATKGAPASEAKPARRGRPSKADKAAAEKAAAKPTAPVVH